MPGLNVGFRIVQGALFSFPAVGEGLSTGGDTVLDAGGRTLLPAFIDLHCHFRTPGFEYKEDIDSGSRAAARGGYTFVNCMANTRPVCSSAAIARASWTTPGASACAT